jgi:uncharacterized protein
MICADPELSALDENLSKVFKEAMKSTDDKDQLKKDQFAWMKERNKCKSDKCIKLKYQEKLVLFENAKYINQLKIDKNVSMYYVDYHILIPELQNGKYQPRKECMQCQKNGICEAFIDDIKNNLNIEWLVPTVQATTFDDPSLHQYLKSFPAWIQSEIKERVYLTSANRYFDINREKSEWNDYPYQTKWIKMYDIKDAKNPGYFILADGFYSPKLGLFGEKREINGEYSTEDEALGIYMFLDKNSKTINKFDYIESTVKLSKKMSYIREIIRYRQEIYLLEARFTKNQFDTVSLSLIKNLKTDSSLNPSVLPVTCIFNKIEEK